MSKHAVDQNVSTTTEYAYRNRTTGAIYNPENDYGFYGGRNWEEVKRTVRVEYGEWKSIEKEEID